VNGREKGASDLGAAPFTSRRTHSGFKNDTRALEVVDTNCDFVMIHLNGGDCEDYSLFRRVRKIAKSDC